MCMSAWLALRRRHMQCALRSLRGALLLAVPAVWAALFSGHYQAQKVYAHQPAKLAALEGHFASGAGDLTLFGLPDAKAETVRYRVAVPGGLSLLLHGDPHSEVIGLDKIRAADRPPLLIPFLSWRVMVGIGTFFIVITALACLYLWRGTLFSQRWLLWIFVLSVLPAVAANQAGWVAAEVGRQPWIVHPPIAQNGDGTPRVEQDGCVRYDETLGLRTGAGLSQNVQPAQIAATIAGFGFVYLLLFLVWVYVLNDKIQQGPEGFPAGEEPQDFLTVASGQKHMADS